MVNMNDKRLNGIRTSDTEDKSDKYVRCFTRKNHDSSDTPRYTSYNFRENAIFIGDMFPLASKFRGVFAPDKTIDEGGDVPSRCE